MRPGSCLAIGRPVRSDSWETAVGSQNRRYDGRLELTWTNKHKRLLSHDDGSYEWTDPADYRVAEVRLLHNHSTVGVTASDTKRRGDNLLIRGDALHALTSLVELPEFAQEYAGKVKLAYIDPPFNTGQAFAHYDDNLEHSVWLTMIRDRLRQINKLLAPDGSVWVHLDDVESHRARVLLDEEFGIDNFVATFTWQKLYARKSNSQVSSNHDFIHVYRKSPAFSVQKLTASAAQLARYQNRDDDPRGPWQSVSFHVRTDRPERRQEYRYEVTLPSGRSVGPPPGRHWNGKRARYEELVADNLIWFGADGDSLPRFKQFLDLDSIGLVPFTIWPRDEVGDNEQSKNEVQALFPELRDVFATPKPERLMQRITSLGTREGDIVLDCFAGSGTTAAVAHKMGRRWIAVESSPETVATFTLPRLTAVASGEDQGGISTVEVPTGEGLPDGIAPGSASLAARVIGQLTDAGYLDEVGVETADAVVQILRDVERVDTQVVWTGGGGFRVLDVAPSMFAAADGMVFLANWATDGDLQEAVAAQLGFSYEPAAPFCGRKGRTRLSVVDGLVNDDVVRLLVAALDDGDRILIAATSVDPQADESLRTIRPGSKLRKIPQAILRNYRRQTKLTELAPPTAEPHTSEESR